MLMVLAEKKPTICMEADRGGGHEQLISNNGGEECSNAEKLLKYDRKQLILSYMYSPS